MPFSLAELKDLLTWGGPAFTGLVLLLAAVVVLWRWNVSLLAKLDESQKRTIEAGREVIPAVERSTSVIDQLGKVEEQRGAQFSVILHRIVDQLANMDRQIVVLQSTTLKGEPFQEMVRQRYDTLRQEMRALTADVVQAIAELEEQHSRWQETVRTLVENATSEVRVVREMLKGRR